MDGTQVTGLIAYKVHPPPPHKNKQQKLWKIQPLSRRGKREQRIKNSFKTINAALILSEHIINS